MEDLFRELGDLKQNLFILNKIKQEKILRVDEEKKLDKEIKQVKSKIIKIEKELKKGE